MTSKEIIESIWAASRASDVWIFLLCMVALICVSVWLDIKKDKRRVA